MARSTLNPFIASLRMRNQDPFQRPTAADLLRHPFFARDPFLEIMLFLQSFRVHSQDAKKVFSGFSLLLI